MGTDAYDVLAGHLGFPGSARLRLILENLMTPDEAKMVEALPGTPQEVAEKTGFDTGRVVEVLDKMFFLGVVFPKGDFRKREYFRFARTAGQFFESTQARFQRVPGEDTEFFTLWRDFSYKELYPSMAKSNNAQAIPALRVVPAWKSIKDLPGILPYENYPEIIRAQELITTVPCGCRWMETGAGHSCSAHDEAAHPVCFQFGRGADYAAASESGQVLTIEEALELSDIAEESGLIHSVFNHDAMTGWNTTCNCCGDCCLIVLPMRMEGFPLSKAWSKSRYEASCAQEDCDGCQDCVERCPLDAIEMVKPEGDGGKAGAKKLKALVDPEACFGCGVCVVGCETGALKMTCVRPPEHIPAKAVK